MKATQHSAGSFRRHLHLGRRRPSRVTLWGTPEGSRCQGCRDRPGPREGAEWSSRAEVGGDSRLGARARSRAPDPARGSGVAPGDHRAPPGRGRRPGLSSRVAWAWVSGGRAPPVLGGRGPQVPRALGRPGPRRGARGAGAAAGLGPRSLARPPVRASVWAASRAGAGARGRHRKSPRHPHPVPRPCRPPRPRAPRPRAPAPRRCHRRRRCRRHSRPPPARWA